jgi:hypothetical protein
LLRKISLLLASWWILKFLIKQITALMPPVSYVERLCFSGIEE